MGYAHAYFDAIYAEAFRRLTVRISAATSKRRAHNAYHDRHSMQINYEFLRGCYAKDERLIVCKCCGRLDFAHYVDQTREQMYERGLCFNCNLWTNRATTPHPDGLIIEGECYTAGPRQAPGTPFLGHGGREFRWKMIDDETEFNTNNMWSGGTIPEEFLHILPDNAVLIKGFHAPYMMP